MVTLQFAVCATKLAACPVCRKHIFSIVGYHRFDGDDGNATIGDGANQAAAPLVEVKMRRGPAVVCLGVLLWICGCCVDRHQVAGSDNV